MSKKTRRECTKCNSKRYTSKMFYIYLPLIGKDYWVCHSCYDMYASDDNVETDESHNFYRKLPTPLFL